MVKASATYIFLVLSFVVFSQNKFVGGKFCENGVSPSQSHSIFDSLGNYFSIGDDGQGKSSEDTFYLAAMNSVFYSSFGKWSYNIKNSQVVRDTHDSIPLVEIGSPDLNSSGVKKFTATDFYGKKIYRFRFFVFISETEVVEIRSDNLSGILKVDISSYSQIIIPGLDNPIMSNTLLGDYNIRYAVPVELVYNLRPINKHYQEHRNEVYRTIFRWSGSRLKPQGKFWLYLCDF